MGKTVGVIAPRDAPLLFAMLMTEIVLTVAKQVTTDTDALSVRQEDMVPTVHPSVLFDVKIMNAIM